MAIDRGHLNGKNDLLETRVHPEYGECVVTRRNKIQKFPPLGRKPPVIRNLTHLHVINTGFFSAGLQTHTT